MVRGAWQCGSAAEHLPGLYKVLRGWVLYEKKEG